MNHSCSSAGIRNNLRGAARYAAMAALASCACWFVLPTCTTRADSPAATPSAGDELADKRAKVAERIAKLTPPADAPAATNPAAQVDSEAADELDLLRSLDLVYLQQQAAIAERSNLEQEKKRLQDEVDSLHNFGPAEAKPYSFLLWEDLRDQVSGAEERIAALKSDLAAAQQMLGTERQNLAECEHERRQVHEAAGENKDPARQADLDRELRLGELNSTIAQETVDLRRAEIDVKTARQELATAQLAYLQEKAERIGKDVRYTERDYQARLLELTKRGEKLRQGLQTAQQRLHQHETQRATVLAKLGQDHSDKSVVAAANEAYQLARRVDCEEITLVNQRLDELTHFKHFVTCRYEMMNKTASHEDLADWYTQLTELLERLEATEHSLAIRIDEIRVDQATLLEHADDAETRDPAVKPFVDVQLDELRHLAERCESGLLHLKARRRSLERFHDELKEASTVPAGSHPLAALGQSLGTFWNYELASVGDDPITVGKIVSGIFYLLVGVVLARLISGLVGRHVLTRFRLNEGAIHAIQAITFYTLCVSFSFEILKLIHVPFASFTFLGGAVAIAVGFGCQNILNNFISGLILLAEQPIRVGDHVEIDGTRGMVERIGAQHAGQDHRQSRADRAQQQAAGRQGHESHLVRQPGAHRDRGDPGPQPAGGRSPLAPAASGHRARQGARRSQARGLADELQQVRIFVRAALLAEDERPDGLPRRGKRRAASRQQSAGRHRRREQQAGHDHGCSAAPHGRGRRRFGQTARQGCGRARIAQGRLRPERKITSALNPSPSRERVG